VQAGAQSRPHQHDYAANPEQDSGQPASADALAAAAEPFQQQKPKRRDGNHQRSQAGWM